MNGTVELAGPEQFRLDELAQRVLRANNDPREVTADVHARYFGAELDEHSLTPGDNPRIAPTHFEDWLSQSADPEDVLMNPTIVLVHGAFADLRAGTASSNRCAAQDTP